MEDFVTVIVPVYKIKEEYLRQCIESLIRQTKDGYKVILVDDGSPDNCGAICDEYAAKTDVITVVHQKNQGVSVARNTGIEMTATPWLTFIDADDWVEEKYIETIYNTVSTKAENSDVVFFDYVREYRTSKSFESLGLIEGFMCSRDVDICKRATFYKLIQNGKFNPYTVIGLMTKVYRTDFINANKLRFIPAARKGQDRLFNADALNSTDKIYYLPATLFHYRCWEDSRTNRFDPNVPELTAIELSNLADILKKHNIESLAYDYYLCRVCTRLYASMRLYYFHPQNTLSPKKQIEQAKSLTESEPYCSALKQVNMKLLSAQERIFVTCLKNKKYYTCRVLVKIKSGLFSRKLS